MAWTPDLGTISIRIWVEGFMDVITMHNLILICQQVDDDLWFGYIFHNLHVYSFNLSSDASNNKRPKALCILSFILNPETRPPPSPTVTVYPAFVFWCLKKHSFIKKSVEVGWRLGWGSRDRGISDYLYFSSRGQKLYTYGNKIHAGLK